MIKYFQELIDIIINDQLTEKVEQFRSILKKDPDIIHARISNNVLRSVMPWYSEYTKNITLLHVAARWNCVEIARFLMEEGADVNATSVDQFQNTPLHEAAFCGSKEVAELLLKHGANIESKDHYGNTPLHDASHRGYDAIVKLLLAIGANPNAVDDYRRTPLHIASKEGHLKVVEALLSKNSDVNAVNNYGWISLLHAIVAGHKEVAALLIKYTLVHNHKADKPDYLTEKYSTYWDKCITEINKMKEYTLGNMSKKKVSLYDFFAANDSNQLALYMSNEDIVAILNTSDYKEKFLGYASKIEEQYKEGMERNCVLNSAKNYYSIKRLSSTIAVVREKFDEYIFQEIFKYADNALLKEILPHRDELASVKGAQNSSDPQLSVEEDKTVNSYLSNVRVKKHNKCVIL
ncbi:ankyrin repeat domain-containing protein [Wolbachia endosymbiont of Folsomia candida]|uniref:ankyrin repeat domain-containing protein n=1 Tax=Wolbachia endosymbiont of Folsomia candida TaxID=169402 RepID=UPI000A62AB91|nr:ankyrin repeat domain-containing protein [Wolbachia endosymbiont of Folsomia candida]